MFLQLLNNMFISPNLIYKSYIDVEMSKGKNVNKLGRLILLTTILTNIVVNRNTGLQIIFVFNNLISL